MSALIGSLLLLLLLLSLVIFTAFLASLDAALSYFLHTASNNMSTSSHINFISNPFDGVLSKGFLEKM